MVDTPSENLQILTWRKTDFSVVEAASNNRLDRDCGVCGFSRLHT